MRLRQAVVCSARRCGPDLPPPSLPPSVIAAHVTTLLCLRDLVPLPLRLFPPMLKSHGYPAVCDSRPKPCASSARRAVDPGAAKLVVLQLFVDIACIEVLCTGTSGLRAARV